jgi:hypothetical protein
MKSLVWTDPSGYRRDMRGWVETSRAPQKPSMYTDMFFKSFIQPISMFDLEFNRQHQVTLVRFHGRLSVQDFAELDATAPVMVAAEGPTDCIFDFSALDSVDLPVNFLSRRAQQRHLCPGHRRVIVAPQAELEAAARLFGDCQGAIGCETPMVVRTLDAALAWLNCPRSGFRPVETAWLRASIFAEEAASLH